MVDYSEGRDCEHGRQIGKCVDCDYQDLLGELSDMRDERDALKAELEATKTAYAHMIKLKDELCTESERDNLFI